MKVTSVVLGLVISCAASGLAGCGENPDVAKREALARGNDFFEQEKYNEASIEFRKAIQHDPMYGQARERLSETYSNLNNPQGAFREIVRAADLLPNDVKVQLRAGAFLLAAGQFEDALGRADRALALDSKNTDAYVLRGNALAGLKNLDGALKELETAISIDPSSAGSYTSIGAIQMVKGDQAEAEAAYKSAIDADPSSTSIRAAYANFLLVANRPDEAERQLTEAHKTAPKDDTLNRSLATFYMLRGRAKDAEPYLQALAENANGADAQFTLARLYLASNRKSEAVRLLTGMAAGKGSAAHEATLMLARIAFADGQRAEGYRLVDQVLASSSNNPSAMLLNAEFKLADNRPKEAAADAQRAIDGDPRLVQAQFVLGQAQAALQQYEAAKKAFNAVLALEPRSIRAQLALSRLHLLTGSNDLARQFADRAKTASPNALETRAAVVRAALSRNDLRSADAELKALLKDYPASADALVLDGSLRLLQRDMAGAQRAFSRALELAPQSAGAANGLVHTYFSTNRQAEARAFVERLVVEHPRDANARVLAARTYASVKEYQKSEESLRKALELDPNRLEAYGMLGQLFLMQSQVNEAIKEFQALATQRPDSVVPPTIIGLLYDQQKRYDEAKDMYRKALAIDRGAPVAANNLAWLYAQSNENLDEALALAQASRAKLADSPDVADTLGWVYHRKGLSSQAITYLKESVEKRPEQALFSYHLGLAYAKNNDLALARKTLERALQLEPASEYAADARAQLARIGTLGS